MLVPNNFGIHDARMEPLVIVTWRDAHFHHSADDLTDEFLVRTVGWLLSESPELQLAAERAPDEDRAVTCIPLALVDDISFLEKAPDVHAATQAGWDDITAIPA